MVELPVEVTVPSQISRSWEALSWKETSLVQMVTPPPLTDETVAVADEAFTVRTRASPTVFGLTARELTPLPCASASPPTAVMVGGPAEASPASSPTGNDARAMHAAAIHRRRWGGRRGLWAPLNGHRLSWRCRPPSLPLRPDATCVDCVDRLVSPSANPCLLSLPHAVPCPAWPTSYPVIRPPASG